MSGRSIGLLFDLLVAVDLPYNRAPSLHIGVLVILWARFAPRLSGGWLLVLHAWFGAIGISVLTTFQHHVIDIPAGLAVASLSLALTAGGRLQWLQRLRMVRVPALARASVR